MFLDLLVNVLALIAFLFIGGSIFKERPVYRDASKKQKIKLGLLSSIMAMILMMLSIEVPNSHIILDLRNLVLVITYYFGGILPSVISATFIIIYRVILQGFNLPSMISMIIVVLSIVLFWLNDLMMMQNKSKLIINFFVSTMIVIISLSFVIHENTLLYLASFFSVSTLGFVVLYFLIIYVETSNDLFRKYKENATKDFLTGLYNTRQFDMIFNNIVKDIKFTKSYFSVLILDIDYFKSINDQYGHKNGDLILKKLSHTLNTHKLKNMTIARIGGEEFSILAVGYTKDELYHFSENLRLMVENQQFINDNGQAIQITISIGVAVYPETTNSLDRIIEKADVALYQSKRKGRNQVTID